MCCYCIDFVVLDKNIFLFVNSQPRNEIKNFLKFYARNTEEINFLKFKELFFKNKIIV